MMRRRPLLSESMTAFGGIARVFGATARGLVLDGVAAGANLAHHVEAAVQGRDLGASTLRVRVVILADEKGTPLVRPAMLSGSLARAERVFLEQAGVRIRVSGIHVLTQPAPPEALDPRANRALLWDDICGRTAFIRRAVPASPILSVCGDPITVVVVRNIRGTVTGCSLGATANWVLCQASLFDHANRRTYDETVLAHELGHALNLPHHRNPDNLMCPTSSPPGKLRGTRLTRWQSVIVTANRHLVPPV